MINGKIQDAVSADTGVSLSEPNSYCAPCGVRNVGQATGTQGR